MFRWKKFDVIASYRPFDGNGNPSRLHDTSGVGFPVAEHFSETAGPGCKVCSIKLYSSTGGASVETKLLVKVRAIY